jgi:hypothetical protein
MHLPVSISSEISEHFAHHLNDNPSDYVVAYGSSVYSPEKVTSDVDVFAVTHSAGKLAIGSLVSFIKDLHIRHGRKLDAEVPYENKVHYTSEEIESAVQFAGFDIQGPHIIVPPVRKEAAFLQSPQIKARLALNGLTTPHAIIGKDFARYHQARLRAGEAATLLAISLQGQQEFTIDHLRQALTTSKTGASGEMFLGYKTEHPLVDEYLYGVLGGGTERLAKQGVIHPTVEGYTVNWNTFNPAKYMQATAA